MNKDVVLIGGGGHAKVIADIVLRSGDTLLGFLDDSLPVGTSICGFKVIGRVEDYEKFKSAYFLIAIGSNEVRKTISEKLTQVNWYTAVHPSVQISTLGVSIGEGSVIMANSVIGSCADVGKHSIINTSCVIEHDNHIGDYTHISPNATLCGTVSVGNLCHIGAGATVINNISVCENVCIGAGATVIRNIEKSGTYVGVPAVRLS